MKSQRQIKKEHFANLLIVAYADGKWKPQELEFLAKRAVDYGLSEEEIREMLEKLGELKFNIPLNSEEREAQLTDAIYLSLIDGELDKREYEICLMLARRLDLDEKYLDNLIELVRELWENERKTKS